MKRSSSTHFGGIPLDTNTLAGQWITFNHMANHYRKLLSVKPRVNTGLPPNSTAAGGSFHNLTTHPTKTLSSSKSGNKKKKSTNNRHDVLYGSHPDNLNSAAPAAPKPKPVSMELTIKSPLKNGRSKKKALTSHYPEYQVVFGPSSIRSSSDAFMSDETASTVSNEAAKPPPDVQAPIGVTEKIRRFLNHIHQIERSIPSSSSTAAATGKLKKGSGKRVTTAAPQLLTPNHLESRAATVSSPVVSCSRQARHSQCFLPWEPPSPKSPRKCASVSVPSAGLSGGKKGAKPKNAESELLSHSHRKFSKSAHHLNQHLPSGSSPRMTRNKFSGSGGDVHEEMEPEKEFSSSGGGNKRPKNRRRADSIGSIGTICGSEELTAEDDPVSLKDIYSTLEHGLGNEDVLLRRLMGDEDSVPTKSGKSKSGRKVLHEQDHNRRKPEVRICSGEAKSPVKEGGAPTATATTTAGHTNKDSSRDSAYGFSSGESRITTRESTPEKKCLDGLGDFGKPCKDAQTSSTGLADNGQRYGRSMSKDNHRQSSRHGSRKGKRVSSSHDAYINFLAELTQDIVRKGIYTNKGLKILFKSHLDQNKELDSDKLADMMERLRMDLGIPKDDSLDKIEFGYGSISETSSTTFFYTPSGVSTREKLSTESLLLSAKAASSVQVGPADGQQAGPSSSPSTIPSAVIPEAAAAITPSTTTGFCSSGGANTSSNRSSSTGNSEDNFLLGGGRKGGEEEDEGHAYNDDELSLSETEVSQCLRVAGLDDGTMQSVMGILKS